MANEEKANLLLAMLETFGEERLALHLELYRQRMPNAVNKRVRLRSLQKSDLVQAIRVMIIEKKKLEGLFVVENPTYKCSFSKRILPLKGHIQGILLHHSELKQMITLKLKPENPHLQ